MQENIESLGYLLVIVATCVGMVGLWFLKGPDMDHYGDW